MLSWANHLLFLLRSALGDLSDHIFERFFLFWNDWFLVIITVNCASWQIDSLKVVFCNDRDRVGLVDRLLLGDDRVL